MFNIAIYISVFLWLFIFTTLLIPEWCMKYTVIYSVFFAMLIIVFIIDRKRKCKEYLPIGIHKIFKKKSLWLLVLFILIPVSMIVAEEKVEYQIGIPRYIAEAYIISDIPDNCLVPLDFIAISEGVAVVPFVTVVEKKFMESTGRPSSFFQVILEAIICTCEDHQGNRVQVINGLDENGVMQLLWTNEDVLEEH